MPQQLLAQLRRENSLFINLLDSSSTAKLVIDRQGNIHFLNSRAEKMIGEQASLEIVNGQLRLTQSEQARFLVQLKANESGHLLIGLRPNEMGLLQWRNLPEHPDRFIVTLHDPYGTPSFPAKVVQALYAFTEAELEVAELLIKGLTGSEIAISRGVSRETSKTQIKSLLRKTRSRSQNELLRLLLIFCR